MIRSIVFDWGGVLAPPDTPIAAKALSRRRGLDEKALFEDMNTLQYVYSPLSDDSGFFEKICTKYGLKKEEVISALCDVPPNEIMDIARSLKSSGFKIYLLSDQMVFKGEHIRKSYDMSVFTEDYFSYDLGFIKESRKCFEAFLKRSGLDPGECIFIDDNPVNVKNANDTGFNTILFTGKNDLLRKLEGFGINVSLDNQ